ncbi:MAG TPA: hypothetical protein GX525_06500 [Bacilli bacterium]|nr:hypothetical protein [Bacilli bacterium]
MKKRFLSFILLIAICVGLIPHASLAKLDNIPEEVLIFAKNEGLQVFKELVSDEPTDFGFNNLEEVNRVELGEGFLIHYIDPTKLKEAKNIHFLKNTSTEWDFLILSDGKVISSLTIGSFGDQKYEVRKVGGNPEYLEKALKEVQNDNFFLLKDKDISYLVMDNGDILPLLDERMIENMFGQKKKTITAELLIDTLKQVQDDKTIQDKDAGFHNSSDEVSSSVHYPYIVALSAFIALLATVIIGFVIKRKKIRN